VKITRYGIARSFGATPQRSAVGQRRGWIPGGASVARAPTGPD
jgi:hypothetical protein